MFFTAACFFEDFERKGASNLYTNTFSIDTKLKHEKAFDTIGHSILLEKLVRYGLGAELNWFTDYLFNRSQQVEIDGANSQTNCLTSGVPQGSILGPLMFIIFFNDLNDCLQYCDIFQYADDTVILFAAQHIDEIEFAINDDLKRIGSYCQVNELLP